MSVCVQSLRFWELPFVKRSPPEGKQRCKMGAEETEM